MHHLSLNQKVARLAHDGLGICLTPILVAGVACVSVAVFVLDKMDSRSARRDKAQVADEIASTLAS